MAIRVALDHSTRYQYDRPVNLSPHVVRLHPAPHTRTPLHHYELIIEPKNHRLYYQQDPFGNIIARAVFPEPVNELHVHVKLIAELTVINPFDFFVEEYAEKYPFEYDPLLKHELAPYFELCESGPSLMKWVSGIPRDKLRIVDFLVHVNAKLQQRINYTVRMDPGIQSCEETLDLALGSCRDTGWLLVQILRHLGLAARFVSGYLVQLTADEKSLDGPSGTEVDFTDLHAWAEVYIPGAGWIGLDPTSGLFAGEGHIPLACTPDAVSAAPLSGFTDKCEVTFVHHNAVTRVHEDPRVTKPYTEEQWHAIRALGRSVDAEIKALDMRLTMGGEPTFVSIDDMEGAQWNTDALGDHKRERAGVLVERLKHAFALGGFVQYGQGKWYPGEPTPRWALGCYWRNDGVPLWRDARWSADESKSYGFGAAEAKRFGERLAQNLGFDERLLVPGYEDFHHYLWREAQKPLEAKPQPVAAAAAQAQDKEKQKEPATPPQAQFRDDLATALARGLDQPVGYVLPMIWDAYMPGFRPGLWAFPRPTMYLIPGSSAMGMRLPLSQVSYGVEPPPRTAEPREPDAVQAPLEFELEATEIAALSQLAPGVQAPRTGLPPSDTPVRGVSVQDLDFAATQVLPRTAAPASSLPAKKPAGAARTQQGAVGTPPKAAGLPTVHTQRVAPSIHLPYSALTVEPRDGKLYVFMPLLGHLDHYAHLLTAVETTAAELELPVLIEGYDPPRHPALQSLKVTPDPGVIEVNIHPASSWEDLEHNTVTLYEEARQSRLGTEKFMLDGRHTGTGGGNHVTLGGPTPADSPFLRRPDLLRSLITYWQHHPALSYMFSGLFIGPTSQAPRVDERGTDGLRELERSFDEVERGVPPSIVDRALRNFLTDLTGNTHRAEFCIDKLYSPDSTAGRQGLLEFRGFEMPPHARMSLAQMSLLRALVVRFWKEPYRHPLVRWGTALHDRFLLPEAIWTDMRDVIDDFNRAGYPFDLAWFAPFHEFRFPVYGRVEYDGLQLELRMALEPWLVLGEEATAQRQARIVDSAIERLQVKVRGMDPEHYYLTCNGRRLPLQPTGQPDEYFAGVRYKAWKAIFGLHPTTPMHAPLVVDVFDRRLGRAIGGCVYHVNHPGGRAYDTFPVNAYEAESRRISRFWSWGHTAGEAAPPAWVQKLQRAVALTPAQALREPFVEAPNTEYPHTLDLRRLLEQREAV